MSDNLPYAQIPFAAVQPGYKVAYPVMVDGKEIISRGEVFQVRRVGHNRAEITLLHAKTGSLFTNEVKADRPVIVYSQAFGGLMDPTATDALVLAMRDQFMKIVKSHVEGFYTQTIAD